jgi:hypothetical protein
MPGNKLVGSAIALLFGFAAVQGACCKRAHAKPKDDTCAAAYETAQEFRKAAKLLRAKEMLEVCARESCGKFIHRECTGWLEQLRHDLPSVILSVKDATGAPLEDVEVTIDGVLVTSALNGVAITIDPGLREFRFNAKGHAEMLQQVNILPGQQSRPIEVRVGEPADESRVTEPDLRHTDRAAKNDGAAGSSNSIAPYVIGGIGVLGLVGFGVLGTLGRNAHQELRQCFPECARANVDRVSTLYAAANVSLGVGVVGVGAATVLLLTSRSSSTTRSTGLSRSAKLRTIDVRQTRGGVFAELRGSF